jgi:hypothetical protein
MWDVWFYRINYVTFECVPEYVCPLKKDGILYTDTVEKTNILNQQFQSVFTDDPPHDIPDKGPSPHPNNLSTDVDRSL